MKKKARIMTQVRFVTVEQKDDDIRLDRWFNRYYPNLKNGMLQRLLRAKNIRVNMTKATTNQRLKGGDVVRIPPLDIDPKPKEQRTVSATDTAFIQSLIIYKDNDVIVLNKPAGIAVQGGSKTTRHIDGMLDALKFDSNERPKLVHRLDKETSGVLVIARCASVAAKLTKAFATHTARKVYWAVVVGRPKLVSGKIDAPLVKAPCHDGGEQVRVDFENGRRAVSLYRIADHLGKKVSWLELSPLTGRTHQLRVHCGVLNTPILGDYKYDPEQAEILPEGHTKMHLHARFISLPHPNGGMLTVNAPLPKHMKETFDFFGFDENDASDPSKFLTKES